MSKPQLRSAAVRLHRWVGLFSFIVLLVIAATGVILNHGVDLNLDERSVTRPELLGLYGMEPRGEPVAFEARGHRVTGWDGTVFFGGKVTEIRGALAGVAPLTGEIAVVCRDGVYLVDEAGELLEKVSAALLPEEAIEAVAMLPEGGLALRAGGRAFVLRAGMGVEGLEGPAPDWVKEGPVSDEEREELRKSFRGEGLPLSRVILDLHSGRIFGPVGVLVYDFAAVAVVLLSATGLWLAVRNFYRSGRNRGGNGGE